MNKETYAQAFEVWHKNDPVLRGDKYYDVLGFLQDADREIKRLKAERDAAECCISNMVDALVCRKVCVNKTELCIMNNPYCKGFEWLGPKEGEEGEEGC